ncbi:MAG: PGF-pre-PGF domain-containing protein, partial [Methanosarcinales archaeon]
SGENFSNIILKEKYDLHIFKDKTTRYRFKNESNPVMYVNITGNVNGGEITTSIEVLRNTSALVMNSVDGIVYKNINIWVGTSGFAVAKNIKTAVIVFRVDSSWMKAKSLSNNDMKMFRWNGIDWVDLVTTQISRDDSYYYYEAITNSFSPFAITGIRSAAKIPFSMGASEQTSVPQPQETPDNTIIPKEEATGTEQKPTSLLYIMIVIGIIAAVSYLYLSTVNRKK